MQGHDVDRVKVYDGVWLCECAFCRKHFESKRSDASFCTAAHRSAYHRHKEKMKRKIRELDDASTWIEQFVKWDKSSETVATLRDVMARCRYGIQHIVDANEYEQQSIKFEEKTA